jgi:hypothetical protein
MTPRRSDASQPADRRAARAFLVKSIEFLEAAQQSLDAGNNTAATGNAVHAAIAAADAIAAERSGVVWRGEHSQAPAHLETAAGNDGRQAANHLRRVLPLKNRAEYDPTPITAAQARTAVQAAERIVTIAKRIAGS